MSKSDDIEDLFPYPPIEEEDAENEAKRDALEAAHKALGSFIWLGNNLHNAGTPTFRDMYRACLEDAVAAYNATRPER